MIQLAEQNGLLHVMFPSRLDTATCDAVEKAIQKQVLTQNQPVVFDLTGVVFIASMFMRLCVTTSQVLGKDRFRVANPSPNILRAFKIAGLDSFIRI